MATSASTVDLPEEKAYIAHHFNCPTCCAAGLSGGKQARCADGQQLWETYLQAFDAQHDRRPRAHIEPLSSPSTTP
ncbi:hypothetical protein [Comamonas thiooxydans]|uniref:hypothetical protein n=1 Tax=Comamonas thiooxydans TaxID=363952 RepID=UPI000B420585|nr:hypothetical protein [Comamonas thiooxydans]BDB69052.1 hypothetical protein Cthiooxydans_14640 [Comamonas thiooxydans]